MYCHIIPPVSFPLFSHTLSGKKSGNQLNISGLYVLGSILNVMLLYRIAEKYPENPCNTQFCCTGNVTVSYLELSITVSKTIMKMTKTAKVTINN